MLRIDPQYVTAARSATNGADLHELLHHAIRLEHSTIPPYQTAAYSLMPGTNASIRKIIAGVAKEEMLHMAIVANLLNAINGRPLIDDPQFLPVYPGPLPMNIGNLQVGLKKFSKQLIHDVFMEIEAPEHPIPFPGPFAARQFATIGEFYRAIIDKIAELGDGIFTGDGGRQVVAGAGFLPEQLFAITNVETAVRALRRVVEDGEGTSTLPFDVDGRFAHYYLFEQIDRGRQLVQDPAAPNGLSYTGLEIESDLDGVWNIPDNPKAADYPSGSAERTTVQGFNRAYSDLLRLLNRTFNGSPGLIDSAVLSMRHLNSIAQNVVSTQDSHTGKQLGLPFEYVPPS